MTLDARIRLVVTDIDGTLLDSAGRISEEALAMLQRVASGGATVSLATSRRWVGANAVAEELGLDCPLILYDGAITRQYSFWGNARQLPAPARGGAGGGGGAGVPRSASDRAVQWARRREHAHDSC